MAINASVAQFTVFIWSSPNVPKLDTNWFKPVPKSANSPANWLNEFPPVNIDIKLEILLSIFAAVIANIALDSETILLATFGSIPDAPDINPCILFIKSDNWFPKSGNEEPIVKNSVNDAIQLAADNPAIANVNAVIPANTDISTVLAPFINGIILVINWDKLSAIIGIEALAPKATPPTIPPINCPIAVPTACKKLPPLWTNSVKPGILDNPPIAANTNPNSAISTPKANTPNIACGNIFPKPARLLTTIVISVNDNIAGNIASGFRFFNPSNTPPNIAFIVSIAAVMNSGALSLNACNIPITKVNNESIISGPWFANDFNISEITTKIVSAIIGAVVTITPHNVSIVLPNISINCGAKLATPNIIADIPATITVVPVANAPAKVAIPTPTKATPAPNNPTAAPNTAIAAANPNKVGIIGPRIFAATPITTNAPAIATKDTANAPQLKLPNIFIAPANITKALLNPIKPPTLEVASFGNNARKVNTSARDPPNPTKATWICSQFIVPNPINANAVKPKPRAIIFNAFILAFNDFKSFGNNLTKAINIVNVPPIAVIVLAISSQSIVDNIFNAPANITREVAIFIILGILSSFL